MKKTADIIVDKRKYVFILYILIIALSILGMIKVNVNYDMSKYLPDDSATKKGMEQMNEEFGEMASVTVMFDDLTAEEKLDRKAGLEAIREKYKDDAVYISGPVADNDLLVSTIMKELPVIAAVAVICIFAILFLLCSSWIEPFLFMTCIGIAVLVNMGTNGLLPSVSFMTFSIGALLQIGLSMDYSFMLMNRYNQEKQITPEPAEAMKNALKKAFSAMTGSSVTTIVGLLALVFMRFKIGQDMGIVLAKGVFISLLCIFTVLPGLAVKFDRLIGKTQKRSLEFPMNPVMRLVSKIRFIIIPVVIILVAASILLNDRLKISYIKMFENEDQRIIEEAFGADNQIVILYDSEEDGEHVQGYIRWLEEQKEINFVQDYTNTLGREYTYRELAEELGTDASQVRLMYRMYIDAQNEDEFERITLYELICFLDDSVIHDSFFAALIDEEQIKEIEGLRVQLEEGKAQMDAAMAQLDEAESQLALAGMPVDEVESQRQELMQSPAYAMIYFEMSDSELAEVLEQEVSDVDVLLKLHRMYNLDVENVKVKLGECLAFIEEELIGNIALVSAVPDDMKRELLAGMEEIESVKSLMLGENSSRMIVSAALEIEGEETFEFIGRMQEQAEEMFDGEIYLLGDSTMGYEMDKGFGAELNLVTILTVAAIFIVVLITFRSVINSAVLVAVIQGAVYITMAIIALTGVSVNYIALILVQCILMGATIDYGILFLSNYREIRCSEKKSTAIGTAMNRSVKTILTSSLILVSCCLSIGLLMTQKIIAQTCSMIAYGTICAVVMVIFVLPAVTLILDKFIVGKRGIRD